MALGLILTAPSTVLGQDQDPSVQSATQAASTPTDTEILDRAVQESASSVQIHRILDQSAAGPTSQARRIWRDVTAFYAARDYRPAWINDAGGCPQAEALFSVLAGAASHGLEPGDYPTTGLRNALLEHARDPGRRAELDVHLTQLFLAYGRHLAYGRLDPKELDTEWYHRRPVVDLPHVLQDALAQGTVPEHLEALAPTQPGYAELRQALARLREASELGWPSVPEGKFVAGHGDSVAALEAVRLYLKTIGDLPEGPDPEPYRMDALLEGGIRTFQHRHGLKVDGVIGPQTLDQMRVTLGDRIQTVLVNLERQRWFPGIGTRAVVVNIPEYRMRIYENGHPIHVMRIIAGAKDTPTPAFADQITYMETNPPWHVPASIASGEILPKVVEDASYLSSQNFTVLDSLGRTVNPDSIAWSSLEPETLGYRFKQEPGIQNPLGSIKFMFPNQFSVYLHDTPNDRPFGRNDRALSHGCIRIEHPLSFAAYLMKDSPNWSGHRITELVRSGERQWIHLPEPMPICLVYFTAFVEADGKLAFRKDIYGRDVAVAKAMKEFISPCRDLVALSAAALSEPPRPASN